MAKITYTADNGSIEEFVDQAAVDAAVAAAKAATGTIETIQDVKVENTDGTVETLTPEEAGTTDSPSVEVPDVAPETTEAPVDTTETA